jgi:hypothetical protein
VAIDPANGVARLDLRVATLIQVTAHLFIRCIVKTELEFTGEQGCAMPLSKESL